jgi:flagellin
VAGVASNALGATGLSEGVTTATTVAGVGVSAIDLTTATGAQAALTAVDSAINTVNSTRAALGAYQARFTSVVASLATTAENMTASRSRIQDADFAMETANLSRAQILQQAGTAMVAQANQLPQGVLALLRQ